MLYVQITKIMLVMLIVICIDRQKLSVSDVDCNMLYIQIKKLSVSDVDCNMLYV